MPIFELQAKDGTTYEVDAADEQAALTAFQAMDNPTAKAPAGYQPQHFDFDGSKIPGYNPVSGNIEGDDALSQVRTYSAGVLEGIPVAGPAIRGLTERAAAATVAPFTDKTYDELLEMLHGMTQAEKTMNPGLDTAGKVTGAVAGTVPMIAAAPTAFGAGTASLPVRALASGGTGVALGGADSAARSGGDVGEIRSGAVMGGLTGALGPAVAPLVGKGVQMAGDSLLNSNLARALGIDKKSFTLMADALADDGLDTAAARTKLESLGDDAMLMDIGPNLKHMGAGLYSMPGEAKQIIGTAIKDRDAAANWRIRSALDETLGPAPMPNRIIEGIEHNQRALQPQYREVFRNAQPVDTDRIARYLDREIQTLRGDAQRGVRNIRQMLNRVGAEELETNPAVLLNTRQAIDDMLQTVVAGNERNALTNARLAIDDALADAVPGIKEVDAKYAELARQGEAVQRGQTVLASGREAPRPQELVREIREGAQPQGLSVGPSAVPFRLREGARAEIERIVGTNANDRVALQRLIKGEGDWNRARLSTMFGKERAEKIIDLLDRERLFAETSNTVTRNSETAARQAAQRRLEGVGMDSGFGVIDSFKAGGTAGATRAAAIDGVEKIVKALGGLDNQAARNQIAQSLTGKDMAVLDALLKSGSKANVPVEDINRVAQALMLSAGGVGR